MKLFTREEWNELPPKSQGYVLYAQGALRWSKLKDAYNPYRLGSKEDIAFKEGQQMAMLEAQDSEE